MRSHGNLIWSRHRESNPNLTLRRHPFYPLNYGESGVNSRTRFHCQRHVQITSIELSSPACARKVKRWAMR